MSGKETLDFLLAIVVGIIIKAGVNIGNSSILKGTQTQ